MLPDPKITVTETFRDFGLAQLQQMPSGFEKKTRGVFRSAFIQNWFDCLIVWLEANETGFGSDATSQSLALQRHTGIDRDTARRLLNRQNSQSVSFANYLAMVTVFQAKWDQIDVASRRDAVVTAARTTLQFISHEVSRKTDEAVSGTELTDWRWELLCGVYQSEEWTVAMQVKEDSARQEAIHAAGKRILDSLQKTHDCSAEVAATTTEELCSLAKEWLVPWVLFFAMITPRWRF